MAISTHAIICGYDAQQSAKDKWEGWTEIGMVEKGNSGVVVSSRISAKVAWRDIVAMEVETMAWTQAQSIMSKTTSWRNTYTICFI